MTTAGVKLGRVLDRVLGRVLGNLIGKRAEILGGVILVIVGSVILYEHLSGAAQHAAVCRRSAPGRDEALSIKPLAPGCAPTMHGSALRARSASWMFTRCRLHRRMPR